MLFITNGRLIDGTGKDPLENVWLQIKGGLIEEIGAGTEPPKPPDSAITIDAEGMTILPGLMNLHVHIQRRHLHRPDNATPFRFGTPQLESLPDPQRMLWAIKNAWAEMLEGVTTFRDCASNLGIDLKRIFETGVFKGPRFITSAKGITMTGGHGDHRSPVNARIADGPDEVRKAAREQLKAGADWIKLMASAGLGGMPEYEHPAMVEYTFEELRAGVEEAHKRFRPATVHADAAESIKNAIKAGVDCIEHGPLLDDEGAQMMADKNVHFVPTLTGLYNLYQREEDAGNIDFSNLLLEEVIKPHKESVQKAYKAGVLIGTGSDTLGQIVQEIKMLHDYGLTKMESIQAATKNAAEILRLEDKIGTIEKGKEADLIIVPGNPLEDLDVLYNVKEVIRAGERVTAEWLMGTT